MTRKARHRDELPVRTSDSKSPLQINDDDLDSTVPWIDFIAAGVSVHAERRIGWIAVLASHPDLLKFATSRRIQSINRAWRRISSKRARCVYDVLSILELAAKKLPNDCTCVLPDDLDSLFSNYLSQTKAENRSAKDGAEAFVFSWEADENSEDSVPNPPDISLRHFKCLDDLFASIFSPIRYYYWTGWFVNASNFLDGLAKHHDSQSFGMYIQPSSPAGLPSSLKAQIARDRLAAFGWVGPCLAHVFDQLGYSKKDIRGRRTNKSIYLDTNGIQVIDLCNYKFADEAKFNLENLSESRLPLHCSSKHPLDRCILAIEYTGYGSRKLKDDRVPLDNYFLFRLPLGSFGLLSGVLSDVRTKLITYPQPVSAFRMSAVLDRLARLYNETPDDEDLGGCIKQMIKHLAYLSIERPNIETAEYKSPIEFNDFLNTLKLDQLLSDEAGIGVNKFTLDPDPNESNKQSIVGIVYALAASGDASVQEALLAALHTCAEILSLNDELVESLSEVMSSKNSKTGAMKAYKSIDRTIRKNQQIFSDLNLSSKSHLRPLTLVRHIAKLMLSIMQQDIEVHEKLHQWISDHFSFIWLIPHDPSNSLRESLTLPRDKNHVGESERDKKFAQNKFDKIFWESHFRSSSFNFVFSTCDTGDCIKFDLKPILDFAMISLIPSDDLEHSGWLQRKISETRDLINELDSRIGYCSDFELEKLLNIDRLKNRQLHFLELLSTSTIMRCVLSHLDGERLLTDWVQVLLHSYQTVLNKQRPFSREIPEMSQQPQLLLFQDVYGFVGAALDCCRNKLIEKTDSCEYTFEVYFKPEICLKFFRCNEQYRASQETTDPSKLDKLPDIRISSPENIYLHLLNCFKEPIFRLEYSVNLINLWFESVAIVHGESVESLFYDIEDDMATCNDLNQEFTTRKNAILKAFHEQLGPIA